MYPPSNPTSSLDRVASSAIGANALATPLADPLAAIIPPSQSSSQIAAVALAATPVRLEAESLQLVGYRVETVGDVAANGQVISFAGGASDETGTATTSFSGVTGLYDVFVTYFDENDGVGRIEVRLAGSLVDGWNLDQFLPDAYATTATRVRRRVASGVSVGNGAAIQITGQERGGELARVDFLEFLPTEGTPPPADTLAPTASVTASTLSTAGGSTYNFTVTYADNVGINASSLDSSDVRVTGPGSFNQLAEFVSVTPAGSGTPRTATYRITAPGGTWDAADNGTYTIALQAAQVTDTSGNAAAAATLGTFQVSVSPSGGGGGTPTPVRLEAESLQLVGYRVETVGDVAANGQVISFAGGASDETGTATTSFSGVTGLYDVFVTYFDENDGVGRIEVRLAGSLVDGWNLDQFLPDAYATTATRVRRRVASGVSVGNGAAIQITGQERGGELARVDFLEFTPVAAPPPPDTLAPTASVTASTLSTAGGSTYNFTVTYADNVGINASSLDSSDVRVTGPGSFNQLAEFVSVTPAGSGTPRTATYRITAPGGTWDAADNGTYTIALQAAQVTDTSGNAAAASTLGTFQVSIVVLNLIELAQNNISVSESAGTTTIALARTGDLSQAASVAYNTFDSTGTGGVDYTSTSGRITFAPGIASVTVPIQILSDTVLEPNEVFSFVIDRPEGASLGPSRTALLTIVDDDDTSAPTASVSATNLTIGGGDSYTFSVTYTDNLAIDSATLDGSDVRVTGPGSFSQLAELVGVTPAGDGTPRTATYRIVAPGGTWDSADNGTYTLALQANQVRDVRSNVMPATTLGTFQVNITPTPGVTFTFNNFLDASPLELNGSAAVLGSALQLTPAATGEAGSAFLRTPITVDATTSFQTRFQFRIGGGADGADGFTFLLQNSPDGVDALGEPGSSLGYANLEFGTANPITRSLAIEFDTFNSAWDSGGNQISILRDGDVRTPLAVASPTLDLNSGSALTAWVDYSGSTDRLDVFLSSTTTKPTAPLLSFTIDLTAVVGSRAFIGFTAATGGLTNAHDIENWVFTTAAVPPPPPPPPGPTNVISFSQRAVTVNEAAGTASLTINRLGSTSGTATVSYSMTEGTAIAGADYTAATGTVTFAPGASSRTITIPIANDTTPERSETFTVRLSNPVGSALGSQNTSVVTIADNDIGSFTQETIVAGLTLPTAFDWSPDGRRLYVAQKDGIVRLVEDGQLLPTPFVDISRQVNSSRDRGLLGLAVHPQFTTGNPYVYLLFTYDPPEVYLPSSTGDARPDQPGNRPSRLIRVTADASTNFRTVVPGSEVVLLGQNSTWAYTSRPDGNSTDDFSIPPSGIVNGTTITAPAALIEDSEGNIRDYLATDSESHTIGMVRFGTDGSLFVSNGDGTSYNRVDPRTTRVQDLDNLSGKLLRINPITGEGLADNPFYNGNPNSNRSKVYNYGFRNPFRFAVNPATNIPVVGDVGWFTWEEVNTGRGVNFGWPYFEGGGSGTSLRTGDYSGLPAAQAFYASGQPVTAPLLARNHGDGARAIVMGDFYKGTTFPEVYQGALFFTDIENGQVEAVLFNPDGTVNSTKPFAFAPGIAQISSGPDSNLYSTNLFTGEISRWRPA